MTRKTMFRVGLIGGILLIVGCTNSGLTLTSLPAVGPHPAGWRNTHGDLVEHAGGYTSAKIDSGATCVSCHTAVKAADGTIPKSPGASYSCFSCHNGPDGD